MKHFTLLEKPMLDRSIPHSLESEAKLLGAILLHNELLPRLHFLHADDFYSLPMRSVFEAMQILAKAGEAITPFTVQRHIEDVEIFKAVGGVPKYLAAAMASTLDIYDPVEYAKHIHELGQRRRLIDACQSHLDVLYTDNDPVTSDGHMAALRDSLDRLEGAGQFDLFKDNHVVLEEVLQDLDRGSGSYSTGLRTLDECMDGGLFPCKSYGFAARKKVGKTCLAATISANLNLAAVPHLFICGEMSPREVQQRIVNRYTDTFPSAFRSGFGQSAEFSKRIAGAISSMPKHTFFYNAPGLTFSSLRRAVTVAVERKKCKGFILDYWQLVGGKEKGRSTAEHLDDVAQWIADYCRKREVWSITMAQVNQEGNTRGGEGIRLAFDQVYELTRPNLGEPMARLEMMETRYTGWRNAENLWMNAKGPYFEEK